MILFMFSSQNTRQLDEEELLVFQTQSVSWQENIEMLH